MEVILLKDWPSHGYTGDKVSVRNGYARNFLIPRGLAIEASSRNAAQVNHLLAGVNVRKARLRSEAEALAQKLAAIKLDFKLKIGDGGKVFGAVTPKDLEAALKAQGFEIVRKQIKVNEPLKRAGEFKITVKLHAEVQGEFSVVLGLEGELEKPAGEEKKGKSRRGSKKGAKSKDDSGAEEATAETSEAAAAE